MKMNNSTNNTSLEDIMVQELKTGDCSIEHALLVASGLENETQINNYVKKLDGLQEDFRRWQSANTGLPKQKNCRRNTKVKKRSEDYQTANALFRYLWKSRPKTRRSHDYGGFLLSDVIDNHISEDKDIIVGSCEGLTSLYTVLGLREKLDLSILSNYNHILNILESDGRIIIVENTVQKGFDTMAEYSDFQKEGLIHLVASTCNSKGIAKCCEQDLNGAKDDFSRAIELNHDYAAAFYNMGNANYHLGNIETAITNYGCAIELKPDFAVAFKNRGIAKRRFGDWEGSIKDYNIAVGLKRKARGAID